VHPREGAVDLLHAARPRIEHRDPVAGELEGELPLLANAFVDVHRGRL
jgi:hypothetical protein